MSIICHPPTQLLQQAPTLAAVRAGPITAAFAGVDAATVARYNTIFSNDPAAPVTATADDVLATVTALVAPAHRWAHRRQVVRLLSTAWRRHGGVMPAAESTEGSAKRVRGASANQLGRLLSHRRLCRTRDGDSWEVVEPWAQAVTAYLGE